MTTVMSGRWVPPAKGSLRTQASPSAVVARPATAATAAGIAPRWTGMCSACMTIAASASNSAHEQSRRSLMLAEWAALTSTAPISSQAARSAPGDAPRQRDRVHAHSALQPDRAAPRRSPRQPGGTTSVASGSSTIAGPSTRRPAPARRAARRLGSSPPKTPCARALGARGRRPRRRRRSPGRARRRSRARSPARPRRRGRGSRRRARARPRSASRRSPVRPSAVDGQLEGLAAVAQVEHATRLVRRRRRRSASVADGASSASSVSSSPREQDAALDVAAALGDDEPERGEHARRARAEDRRHAELLGDRGGVQRPGAAEGQQRELARVDAALDGHHAQRAHHLRVGDVDDALRRTRRSSEPEPLAERADRRSRRLAVELDRRRPAARRAE